MLLYGPLIAPGNFRCSHVLSDSISIASLTWSAGEKISILVPTFNGSSDFWCQPASSADDLIALGETLGSVCESAAVAMTSLPAVGSLCCARFTVDGLWYRARVLAHEGAQCRVSCTSSPPPRAYSTTAC